MTAPAKVSGELPRPQASANQSNTQESCYDRRLRSADPVIDEDYQTTPHNAELAAADDRILAADSDRQSILRSMAADAALRMQRRQVPAVPPATSPEQASDLIQGYHAHHILEFERAVRTAHSARTPAQGDAQANIETDTSTAQAANQSDI